MRGEEAATPENRSAPISTAPELSLSQTMSFQVRPIRTGDPGRTLHSRFQFAGLETNPANPCQSDRKQLSPGLVEPDGFEPTTSCLQSRRSTN